MTKKQWLIGIVLADFLALNAYVVMEYGYMGFMREIVSTLPGIAVLVDPVSYTHLTLPTILLV